jgi:IS5 family transposase
MQPVDFFRARIDAMINLNDPLAVLATKLPWKQIETSIAIKFEHQQRTGEILEAQDLFGTTQTLLGAGRSNAGRPKLPIRLMASLLYLKHSFNLSDEELVVRWSENIVWQYFSGSDYYRHGSSASSRRPQRPGTRDRGYHRAREGHCTPHGQPLVGDC